MKRTRTTLNRLSVIASMAVVGCTPQIPVPDAARPARFADPAGSWGGYAETGSQVARTTDPELPPEPAGVLTLDQALALAVARSPDLAVFSWDIRSGDAKKLQAALRPNPEFSVAAEDFLGTGIYSGGRQAQTTLRLSQLIELGGKRSARLDVASEFRERAEAEYELKRVQVLADVTEKFIHVVADQHELRLSRDSVALAEDALRAARRRVRAGRASAMEESNARVALARGRVIEGHAEHELKVAKRRLAATWGSTEPAFGKATADLFARKPVPPYEQLADRIAGSPEIGRWVTEERLRAAEVRLADSKRVPDVEVQGGVRRLEGPREEGFVMQLSVPLPLFNRNQGESAETRALREKASAERGAAGVRLRTLVYGLYQELQHATTQLDILEREILPQAERSLAVAREGFAQGKLSQLELVAAQKTFVEVREEAIVAATAYHQNVLEIERLTGLPLDAPPAVGGAGATNHAIGDKQ